MTDPDDIKRAPLKRYLLFAGNCYYPNGGWDDFRGSFDSVEAAKAYEVTIDTESYVGDWWWSIIDTTTLQEVSRGNDSNRLPEAPRT